LVQYHPEDLLNLGHLELLDYLEVLIILGYQLNLEHLLYLELLLVQYHQDDL
jgi:hypothetical protein